MAWVVEQRAVGAQQSVIHPPGVDADRVEPVDVLPSSSQTVEDGAVERESVPVQHPAGGYGLILEPRHLLQMKFLVSYHAEDSSAA